MNISGTENLDSKGKVWAVIVAAGMSSRMGDFKPMMKLGAESVSKRVVDTLKQGGVERIIVVTGNNAEELEAHLSDCDCIFLRNNNYAATQMFDSVCIGFEYACDKCDRILFTPVDIPLFSAATVSRLIDAESHLVYPVCNGKKGHPIALSTEIVKTILKDSGEGGLAGALLRSGYEPEYLIVEDKGILMDADTSDDFQKLVQYHNSMNQKND